MYHETLLGKEPEVISKYLSNEKGYIIKETLPKKELNNVTPRVIRIKKTNNETEILVGYFQNPDYPNNK